MDFRLNEEQQMLQDTVARLVRGEYSFEKRLEYSESELGFSESFWKQLGELGLMAVPFPEELGGFGGTSQRGHTFSVTATGEATLAYQWENNSTGTYQSIADANASSYTTPILDSDDNGTGYRVIVSNLGLPGNTTSNNESVFFIFFVY